MIGYQMTPEQLPDWFVDLIDTRVTSGLDENQQHRFDQFVSEHENQDEVLRLVEQFELTAAALDLRFEESYSSKPSIDLPYELRDKVLHGAKVFFESDHDKSLNETSEDARPKVLAAYPTDKGLQKRTSPGEDLSTREVLGWLVAAASIAVLLTGWNPFAAKSTLAPQTTSIEQEFDRFVASSPKDLTRVSWEPTGAKSKAGGEVLWSDSEQAGFMVFNNLPLNDPKASQYQLWIFDTDAGQKYPVDGGTFDVTRLNKAIVKIDPRISIDKAVMFAITEERPGGVVVSSRERLPLLAKVGP